MEDNFPSHLTNQQLTKHFKNNLYKFVLILTQT